MLDNEEFIIANIKENDPAKKELKIIKWFMFNKIPYNTSASKLFSSRRTTQEGRRAESR